MKNEKPFYKNGWFLIISSVVGLIIVGSFLEEGEQEIKKEKSNSSKYQAEKNDGDKIAASGQASVYIPELNPTDVYLSLEEIGFTTEKDLGSSYGNFWTSTLNKGGIEYTVDVSSDDVNKVQSIRGTAINSNRSPGEVKQFFKYLVDGLFLYNNKDDSRVDNWIENNFNNDKAVTSVGKVKIRISAPSSIIRIIRIDANLEDGM